MFPSCPFTGKHDTTLTGNNVSFPKTLGIRHGRDTFSTIQGITYSTKSEIVFEFATEKSIQSYEASTLFKTTIFVAGSSTTTL